MATPAEKQATVIATATELQNFIRVLQSLKTDGLSTGSIDTSTRAKSEPVLTILLPGETQRQVMRQGTQFPITMISRRPIEFQPLSPQTGSTELTSNMTPGSLR